uniref:Transcription cofactor vestigial-like protein 4 n=1 Tax=Zeugodacus cucurbitae TaxID=28588 RepID=A0A0A1WV75_ZEUCU
METALDVLSRAATMVQDNANEARISSKELPTARWRRERRSRAGEYPTMSSGVANAAASTASTSSSLSPAGTPPPPGVCAVGLTSPVSAHHHVAGVPPPMSIMMAAAMRPLCESTNRPTPPPSNSSAAAAAYQHQSGMESPIDMSVSSSTLKHRSSPPPPYRAPLPGSTYATALVRPSVITQAPSKRERERERGERELLANRENDNRSSDSISTCDTVIDEHFRRSLGPNYAVLFGKKSPGHNPTTPSPQPSAVSMTTTAVINTPTPTPPPTAQPTLSSTSSSSSSLPLLQPQSLVVAHTAAPAGLPPYHATAGAPQALISPKPAAVLLSSAAIYAAAAAAPPPLKADQLDHVMAVDLPPPQQQPLALSTTQRSNTPPQPTTPNVDVCGPAMRSPPLSPTNAATLHSTPPPPAFPAATLRGYAAMEAHSTSSSRSPVTTTPQQSPNSITATPPAVSSSTPPTTTQPATTGSGTATPPPIMPAIMRIKTEPGLAATNTPPASPTSTSSPTSITEVTASVDDHFAKALGDTWKKLQENKEVRK